MSVNKYTKLEKQMRSILDENLVDESWNTPDDSLFLNAIDIVSKEGSVVTEKNHLYLSGILIFSLLLLLIGHSVLFPSQEDLLSENEVVLNSEIVNENASPSIEASSLNEQIKVKPPTNDENIIDNQSITYPSSLESKIIKSQNLATEANNTKTELLTNSKGLESNSIYDSQTVSPVLFNSKKENSSIKNPLIVTENSQSSIAGVELESRNAINFSNLEVQEIDRLTFMSPMQVSGEVSEIKNLNSPFGLFVNIGSSFNSFSIPNPPSDQIKDYTNWQTGAFVDLGIRQNISNKLSLSYEIGYSNFSNASRYFNNMIYDSANEFIDIFGNNVYNCEIEVISPTTGFICDMNLELNHDMLDDEMMLSVTDIVQNYEVVRLGITPMYNIFRKNGFALNVGGNLSANYIASFQQDMDFKIFHDSYIMTRESMVDNDVSKLNRFFVSASANTAITYQWTDKFSVGVLASYGNSLNSISTLKSTLLRDVRIGLTGAYNF